MQCEITFPDQPFVDTNGALHALGSMIRDDQNRGILVGAFEKFTDPGVNKLVVLEDRVFKGVTGLVPPVIFIQVSPKGVVYSVHANFNHHEKVPLLFLKQVFRQLKTPLSHFEDIFEDTALVIRPKIPDIEHVFADYAGYLVL